MQSEGELYYDNNLMRWSINGYELHSGDCIEVHLNGKWETVRIEYDHSTKEFYTIPEVRLHHRLKVRRNPY